jgi:hypothetical protein
MEQVQQREIEKLVTDPHSFTLMMTDEEIAEVLAAFVCALTKPKHMRGGCHS